ncbi:alpha/beta hydrolase [Streptomyces sp. BE20]|uniref:alpha/beta fold hydrolase n=1 Tax=Streptomycetaceae TaxID=2062 RepID=UPI002E78ABC0|nr:MULTISPECIES: alpha/beta hydrolase [unclassified Streptomyces]MED7952975.1 alpha/beta hydrolase [Streptomyces sp. BE303]MEE1821875.1 alpha/beta hydrolase [Streptomyces sp. BE20]
MSSAAPFHTWDVREAGPADAPHRVLLLPGGLCSTAFYEDMTAAPPLADAPIRLVAATVPGHAGTVAPADVSMEHYAAITGAFAAEHGCTVVVGHSIGANIAIEMVGGGHFSGPVVLLSPTFSRPDESRALAVATAIGRVPGLGAAAWPAMLWLAPKALADSIPERRRPALLADLRKNSAPFCRRAMAEYFAYLDRHGSLVPRLCGSGARAWVVRGDRDEVGLTDAEHAALEACPSVTLEVVPDSGHLVMVEQPHAVARLIADVVLGPDR